MIDRSTARTSETTGDSLDQCACLSIERLTLNFGGITALDDMSCTIKRGTITALIGPNGAGKTSLFNCISRFYHPSTGTIQFEGDDVTALNAREIISLGIARTFQNLALISQLTVLENVMLGGHITSTRGYIRSALAPKLLRGEEKRLKASAEDILIYLDMHEYAGRTVASLPYATLKRIELARALITKPKLLLLDEPAGGLTHQEVMDLAELIRKIRDEFSLTVLLVEHHMGMVMKISDEITVLNFGNTIASGDPENIRNDPEVVRAYLGKSS